ncbi:ARM repeat-containing protein [Eremomyces bilateralis CBS 781.70]|uniref:ARM repeat-containing protein n=1 Tax=Eremomyces bilateralis CBS 781.70 TaxID=1392243 RepID=A0A6G1FWM1_9PEZI|nr:ARM repeat-containing protein [Eremomyces bilateralis CBS 781.70]KAF1810086.1 ARM repeat-containing protein [Eremomyces bilateralis CBS 781.70]
MTQDELQAYVIPQRLGSFHQAAPNGQPPFTSANVTAASMGATSAPVGVQRQASFGANKSDDKVSPNKSQRSVEDYEKEILNLKLALAKARITQLEDEANTSESHVTKHTLEQIVSASECDGEIVNDRGLDNSSKHTSPTDAVGMPPWGNTPFLPNNAALPARPTNQAQGMPANALRNAQVSAHHRANRVMGHGANAPKQQGRFSLPSKPPFTGYVPQHSGPYSAAQNAWTYGGIPMNVPRAPAAMIAATGVPGANQVIGRAAPAFSGQATGRAFQGHFPGVNNGNFAGDHLKFTTTDELHDGLNQASAQFTAPRDAIVTKGYTGPMQPNSYAITSAPLSQPVAPWDVVRADSSASADKAKDPWGGSADSVDTTADGTKYVAPHEPINYRLLLEKNATTDWRIIVGKIVDFNDQQASIFLQQKLKSGTEQQKHDIIDAILGSAYGLMINRFGNFLVQRCFEHGTTDQIRRLADSIRGNTLTLSQDPFGCHVIQKAFDSVTEDYKALMIHELLRKIPETVTHRYACHVWQKLFELRWSGSPPQIMKYVNDSLRTMWDKVAMGETGSLVVQNVFENCLEEDKRPCINEVLASIDMICKGQFGNWCIQHICEHGATADKAAAVDHVLANAKDYSLHQYGSKVVEKCLKINANNFIDRYLEIVSEPREDRVRMPLIDISSDQFGNYLIQYILQNCTSRQREIVSTHIRKHMVSLRGNKYGSRVAMLCCNPASNVRPSPPLDVFGPRYGRGYRGRMY